MADTDLTQKQLKRLLKYNPESGIFVWQKRHGHKWWNANRAGRVAGHKDKRYIRIQIDGKRFFAHHLAWLYMTGKVAPSLIDHIDRNGTNNRWSNLRLCSFKQNMANRAPRPSKYANGVRPNGSGYCAQIKVDGKTKYLGTYRTITEAHEAYRRASIEVHGKFSPYDPVVGV